MDVSIRTYIDKKLKPSPLEMGKGEGLGGGLGMVP